MASHAWGDCFNNPKNKTSESQYNNNCNQDRQYGRGYNYSTRGRGNGHGRGNNNRNLPQITNPYPSLYIEQAPGNNVPDTLSTVTNTDNSTAAPNQTYVIKPISNKRGEKNSRRLHDNVVNCDTVHLDEMKCCESAADAINVANVALPRAISHTHHFHLETLLSPQDGVKSKQQCNKNNFAFHAFDTECIQEVDNFHIYIDTFTTEDVDTSIIQQDLLPVSIIIPKYIQNIPSQKVLIALFDSGGTITLVHEHVLLTEVKPFINNKQTFTTLAGEFQSNRQVVLQDIVLPEFKRTAYIDNHTCQVFLGPCLYDIILGRDFLRKIHFHINFDNNTMNCMDMSVPMQSPEFFSDHSRLRDIMFFDDVEVDSFASTITKSSYQPISISTIVHTQNYLSVESSQILSNMLNKHTI